MVITKNSYGVTSVFNSKRFDPDKMGKATGSSLNRTSSTLQDFGRRQVEKSLFSHQRKERREKCMSQRTKTKVRRKIFAFSRVHNKLTFVTLTFLNKIDDEMAIKLLSTFLENASKRFKNLQYLWVAEKQNKNQAFPGNIHFHIITNRYWKIERWMKYWIDLQIKHGIKPRNEKYRPSSAFDVKLIKSTNLKGLSNYLTSYVTKNEASFKCQIWNCSKKVSMLYTSVYESDSFLKRIDGLRVANLLSGEIKKYPQEYCIILIIPLNRYSIKLYIKLDLINASIWNP